jgi:vacuolar-type H+-ATPase subunit I/STV1
VEESGVSEKKKWEFMIRGGSDQIEIGANLLQCMEMIEDEVEDAHWVTEEQLELDEEVIKKITKARSLEVQLPEKKKKTKIEPWGPMLVERNRRKNNSEGSMLQKAMDLKKKKNLEYTRGNSFATLQNIELNKVALDVNIKIGNDAVESGRIIDTLVDSEKNAYDKFVGENSKVLLPPNLDVDINLIPTSVKEGGDQLGCSTPMDSLKEPDSSELWTEVVKKGINRYKNKKNKNDGN